jgi:hypothetical protein
LTDHRDRRTWRPRLWVRCLAVTLPILLASTLLYPQALNPTWTAGTPTDQLPALFVMIAVSGFAAWSTLISRVEVDHTNVRIVNPWGRRELPKRLVREVRPGNYGVELVDQNEQTYIALAVQCTRLYRGSRPRWVELEEAVTGRNRDEGSVP